MAEAEPGRLAVVVDFVDSPVGVLDGTSGHRTSKLQVAVVPQIVCREPALVGHEQDVLDVVEEAVSCF